MKLAALSDIHGNFVAFEACLRYIESNNFDGIVLLGDYITDSPYPRKTLSLIKQAMSKYTTWAVKGNREQYIINYHNNELSGWSYSSKNGTLLYTYESLEVADIEFLDSLPITLAVEIDGCKPFTICHAAPDNLKCMLEVNTEITDTYLKNLKTDYLVGGHTHMPLTYTSFGKLLINPGSVGCPVNGQTNAQFSSLEFIDDVWKNQIISVPYDIDELLEAYEQSGIIEKGKMWAHALMKLVKTGENYPLICLKTAIELASKDNSHEVSEEYWQQAAKELGII